MELTTYSPEETERLGAALAKCLQPGDVIVAEGVGLLREGTEIKTINGE